MEKVIEKIRDPLYAKQFNLRMLRVPEAWQYTQGEGVTIGLLDTGCDGSHKDLGWEYEINITASNAIHPPQYQSVMRAIRQNIHPKILPGWNFITNTDFTWDWHRHGTYLAGTIAAESDGFGMVGVAPLCKIRPYVVLDHKGRGQQETIAKAIIKAVDDGCDVICMSLAWYSPNDKVRDVIQYILSRSKTILVAASGNNNRNKLSYPAGYDGVIAVGGATATGERWVHSKYKGANYGTGLTCVGPASAQITTKRMRSRFTSQVDATSMACANIAGVAALAKSLDKNLDQEKFKLLLDTWGSNDIWDAETGWGVPNALEIAKELSDPFMPNLKELQSNLYNLSYDIYAIGDKLGQIEGSDAESATPA